MLRQQLTVVVVKKNKEISDHSSFSLIGSLIDLNFKNVSEAAIV